MKTINYYPPEDNDPCPENAHDWEFMGEHGRFDGYVCRKFEAGKLVEP